MSTTPTFTMLQSPAPVSRQPSRHQLQDGTLIYTLPVRVFGEMTANVYLLRRGDYLALIDTGNGSDTSNADLLSALAEMRQLYGEQATLADLSRIVITHGHIDHHGGLDFVRSHSPAPVAIHALDAAVLNHYPERKVRHRRTLLNFLESSGIPPELSQEFLNMNASGKLRFVGSPPQTILEDGDVLDGVFQVIHTPGHCPGMVCLRLNEVLFSADQILAHTTPHLAPESLALSNGLGHYLVSLSRLEAEQGLSLILGGHEEPMTDLHARSAAIRESYERKIERILEFCAEPHSLYQIYQRLYPRVKGYDQLLALEKVGAMVEYLNARGLVLMNNLTELQQDPHTTPQYRRA